jgi:uncharacterized delta-60 repeat protein
MKIYRVMLALHLAIILVCPVKLFSQAGQLDPTFGRGGIVNTVFNVWSYGGANSTAIQNDGKIIAVGSSLGDFGIVRYNTDGSLDYTFGTNGIVITATGSSNSIAQSVAIQSDGKIVAAGYGFNGSYNAFLLARFNLNGELDTTFGAHGFVSTQMGTTDSRISSIALQDDDMIVATGFCFNRSNADFATVRYSKDGALDLSFGFEGTVITPVRTSNDEARSVAIQDDGRIVVAGSSNNGIDKVDVALVRYQSNGSIDSTFGTNGIAITSDGNPTSRANAVTIQDDGKIVAAGSSSNQTIGEFELVRYESDGTLDAAFGSNGIVHTLVGNIANAHSIAIQSTGEIIATGPTYNGNDYNFATVRYNKNGSLDNSFGINGTVINEIPAGNNPVQSVAVQTDGKIIISGSSVNGINTDFTIMRYNTDGSLDNTFSISGIAETPVGISSNFALSSVLQNDGKIIEVGYTKNPNIGSDYDFAVCRFNEDGSPDNVFGDNGISVTREETYDEYGRSVALQSDGKIIVAGNSLLGTLSQFALARYNSNGVLDKNFGKDGMVNTMIGNHYDDKITSVAIRNDDMIVTAGYSNNDGSFDMALARYKPNGDLDNTFGTDGKVITSLGAEDDIINSIALQNDGKIIAAGYTSIEDKLNIAVLRYDPDGSVDVSFGRNGIVTTPAGSYDEAYSVAIQSDGRIVAAGSAKNGDNTDFVLVRYKSSGDPDSTFGVNGIVITPIGSGDDQINSVAIQGDGKILVGGTSSVDSTSDFVVARYNKNGTLDNTFGTNGVIIVPLGNSYSGVNSIMVQKDGKILAAGSSWDGRNYSVFSLLRFSADVPTGIKENNGGGISASSVLEQNYPNPFNLSTRIKYSIASPSFVTLKIYNSMGQEIKTLVNQDQNTGHYEVTFYSGGFEDGVYFCRLTAGNYAETRRMILSK